MESYSSPVSPPTLRSRCLTQWITCSFPIKSKKESNKEEPTLELLFFSVEAFFFFVCVCSCFFFSFPPFFLAVTKKYKKVVSQSPVFFFSSLFPNHGLFLLNRFSFFLFSFWCFLQSTSKKKKKKRRLVFFFSAGSCLPACYLDSIFLILL